MKRSVGICLVEVKENALIDPGAVMTEVTVSINVQ